VTGVVQVLLELNDASQAVSGWQLMRTALIKRNNLADIITQHVPYGGVSDLPQNTLPFTPIVEPAV